MMGQPQPKKDLFSYRIDLDQRVRPDHPLRAIKTAVDSSSSAPRLRLATGTTATNRCHPKSSLS